MVGKRYYTGPEEILEKAVNAFKNEAYLRGFQDGKTREREEILSIIRSTRIMQWPYSVEFERGVQAALDYLERKFGERSGR